MKKYLFMLDLDGTTLSDSSTSEIPENVIKAVKNATKLGHKVVIATGRPWRAAKKAYETLGLNTVIANVNAGHIHNPTDYSFIPQTTYMKLNDVMYILGDERLKEIITNVAIEGPGWVMVDKHDEALNRVFGFKSAESYKEGLNYHKLPLEPNGVVFDVELDTDAAKLRHYIKSKYGDLVECSSWSKGAGLSPVFDLTAIGVNKGKAMSYLARYYDIDVEHTIAIGDAYNDLPMFERAHISVAMGNAPTDVKDSATHVTDSNLNGGVGIFIDKFLNDDKFRASIEDKSTISHKSQIVAAH